ncbi:hypothetical protein SDJN03_18825, partial [Cucurbita argyrosperma subsp. sororia]
MQAKEANRTMTCVSREEEEEHVVASKDTCQVGRCLTRHNASSRLESLTQFDLLAQLENQCTTWFSICNPTCFRIVNSHVSRVVAGKSNNISTWGVSNVHPRS